MIEASHSSKLASLIQLCFYAGIIFSSGSVLAGACNLNEASICTQPGPGHSLPSICDQYPGTLQCIGGGGGSSGTVAAVSLGEIIGDIATAKVPHISGNSIQAGCASSYELRKASALRDVSAWWPTFGGWVYVMNGTGPTWQTVAVTYSNGQREIWALDYRQTSGTDPMFVGTNPNSSLGRGVLDSYGPEGSWGIYGQYAVAAGGVYGGGPGVYEYCQ